MSNNPSMHYNSRQACSGVYLASSASHTQPADGDKWDSSPVHASTQQAAQLALVTLDNARASPRFGKDYERLSELRGR
ncbi:hypothetical protein E5D57_009447 [Metarhizium anisopliae]|nr:hypothetical protein E5D57_009447 [Metarhizium anisopliae]